MPRPVCPGANAAAVPTTARWSKARTAPISAALCVKFVVTAAFTSIKTVHNHHKKEGEED